MSEDLASYIRKTCIYGKLAERPLVGQWRHLRLVFVRGYPMTTRGFYVMSNKAIFGASIKLSKTLWEELHAETRLLCQGTGHELQEGKEAYQVVDALRLAMGWTKEGVDKPNALLEWIGEVDEAIRSLDTSLTQTDDLDNQRAAREVR